MDHVNVLIFGKRLTFATPTGLQECVFDRERILSELILNQVSSVIDLSRVEDDSPYSPGQLSYALSTRQIGYQNNSSSIPSAAIIKGPLYEDILTEEEKAEYQVSVLFNNFCLHNLPIMIYNEELANPGRTVAILFDDWNYTDTLRLHFSASVYKEHIKYIQLSHLYPVFKKSSTTSYSPSFTKIANSDLTAFFPYRYERINATPDIFKSISRDVDQIRFLNTYADFLEYSQPVNQPVPDDHLKAIQDQINKVILSPEIQTPTESEPVKPTEIDVFITQYVGVNNGGGVLTRRILNFKDDQINEVEYWTSKFIETIQDRNTHFDIIVRALGSNELSSSGNKPMDKVGREIEKKFGFKYFPQLLKKTRLTKPLKYIKGGPAPRKSEIEGVYYVLKEDQDYNGKNILLIDDIYTTGTTANEIKRAILKQWPNAILYGHYLAKTVWIKYY